MNHWVAFCCQPSYDSEYRRLSIVNLLMTLSRREFLMRLLGASAFATQLPIHQLQAFVGQEHHLALQDSAPPLDSDQVAVLVAMTEALFINYPIQTAHYAAFFRYRHQHHPIEAPAFPQIANELNYVAQNEYGGAFVDLDLDTRRAILASNIDHAFAGGEASRFNPQIINFILEKLLTLFMNTDAWVIAGYANWSGQARGFDAYQQALGDV